MCRGREGADAGAGAEEVLVQGADMVVLRCRGAEMHKCIGASAEEVQVWQVQRGAGAEKVQRFTRGADMKVLRSRRGAE